MGNLSITINALNIEEARELLGARKGSDFSIAQQLMEAKDLLDAIADAVNYVPGVGEGTLLDRVVETSHTAAELADGAASVLGPIALALQIEEDAEPAYIAEVAKRANAAARLLNEIALQLDYHGDDDAPIPGMVQAKLGELIRVQAKLGELIRVQEELRQVRERMAEAPAVSAEAIYAARGYDGAGEPVTPEAPLPSGVDACSVPEEASAQQPASSNAAEPERPEISSTTGLGMGETMEIKAPNEKRVILERVRPRVNPKPGDQERYSLKTPRDREIAQLAYQGPGGGWSALMLPGGVAGVQWASPAFVTYDEALAWVWARDKYTGGTSPADMAQREKARQEHEREIIEKAGFTEQELTAWADLCEELGIPEHANALELKRRIDAGLFDRSKLQAAAAAEVLEETPQDQPVAEEPTAAAPAFAEGQVVTWDSTTSTTWGLDAYQGKVVDARAGDTVLLELPNGKNRRVPVGLVRPLSAEELEVASRHQGPTTPVPNPQAPREVQEATKAIAQWEATHPEAALQAGARVTVLTEEGRIEFATIEKHFDGSTRYEVKIEGGARVVLPADRIRGRADEPADLVPPDREAFDPEKHQLPAFEDETLEDQAAAEGNRLVTVDERRELAEFAKSRKVGPDRINALIKEHFQVERSAELKAASLPKLRELIQAEADAHVF